MSLNARMSEGDPRLYNPSRDVAHNFGDVLETVAGRLEDHAWPELDEILKREGVTLDDLGEACGCYCEYIALAVKDPQKSMICSMVDSGFFECEPAAQVAVMAMVGTVYAGIQFVGVRETTIDSSGPLHSVSTLLEHAERFRKYQGMPRWRRKLERFKLRLGTAIASFRGKL